MRNVIIRWAFGMLAMAIGTAAFSQDKTGDYQLGAGDTIRVQVFQNPDLALETRVSESGTITYPLVGALKVGGMTLGAAEQVIAKSLKDGGFVQQPQVTIVLLQNRGNQVAVLGQVARPGRFPLETFNMRLTEVLALAGGIAPTGADSIILVGQRAGKPYRKEIDIVGMFLDNKMADDLVIGGDTIYVHRAPMFYVYGEVQRPGMHRIERGMTVRQAIAFAGGITQRGTENWLKIYRRQSAGVEVVSPTHDDPVLPDDVIYVRESFF